MGELPDALPHAKQQVGLPVAHEAPEWQLQQPTILHPFLEAEPLPHGQHAEGHRQRRIQDVRHCSSTYVHGYKA